jgi:hypothetical protein
LNFRYPIMTHISPLTTIHPALGVCFASRNCSGRIRMAHIQVRPATIFTRS